MSIPPARSMSLDILRYCLDQHQDIQAAVNRVLQKAAPGLDQGLATELAYGYLRYKGRIDFLLGQLLSKPAQTSPIIKRILGVAIYELLFLCRIPEYATLNWAVNLVKQCTSQTMGKVANGVLRNVLRLGQTVHYPDYYKAKAVDYPTYLAAWYACPLWLVQLWLQDYGKESTQAFLQSTLQTPPTGVRINNTHLEAAKLHDKLRSLATRSWEWGMALKEWPEYLHQAVAQGHLTRQSLAAQEIMLELKAADWPSPVYDACAGRGGKTFFLAEMGKEVWASDTNTFRLQQCRQESKRLGLPVPIFQASGIKSYPVHKEPRTILLDVPCSGLGVLSRRPDIKWKRTLADCEQLVALQRNILDQAAQELAPGGLLVYLTCTLTRQENELQIERFIQEHPKFSCVQQTQSSPDTALHEYFYGAVLHHTGRPKQNHVQSDLDKKKV